MCWHKSTPKDDSMAITKSEASSLMLVLKLIERNDWAKLNSVFLQAEKFQTIAALVNESSSFNGMTLLHAVCRFNPPSSVVRNMILLCPDDAKARDCLNRTALHVATGTGASASVTHGMRSI